MAEPVRQALLEIIRRLPADQLPQAAALLSQLDLDSQQHSTTQTQRLAARMVSGLRVQSEEQYRNESGDSSLHSKDWPHAPVHRISEHGTYIVTAGTLAKEHFFRGADRLTLLESKLLTLARRFRWELEAWAVFSNHYHFVGNSSADSADVRTFITHLHTETSTELNQMDGSPARQVWFNYWDTRLTYEKSYLARLNYVHQNAVRHGLVAVANQYRWCSAAWFERTASRAQVGTIYSFKTDRIKVVDDFDPL